MNISKQLAATLLAGVMLVIGCSQGASPVAPPEINICLPAISSQSTNHYLIGFYTFICDPGAGTVDAVPLRATQMHLNALRLLEPPPLVNLTIEGKPKFNGNILDVDIGLRNPYLLLNQYTGFDVCGTVFTHGSLSGFTDPDIVMAGEGDTRLLNADGYTRWWNPKEFPHGDTIFNYVDGLLGNPASGADFNCTVNGCKYFADGLGKDDPLTALNPTNRGVFSAGAKNIRHYKFDLSGGLTFNYAVDACWKMPSGKPPYTVPDSFPPEANKPEAWNVSVTEVENSLYYDDKHNVKGGKLRLLVDVYDHYNAGLNKVYAESLDGLHITSALTPIGGGEGYSTYELDFTGEHLTKNGEIEIYLSIMSEIQGYGGLLLGNPVCAYYEYKTAVNGEPKGWARSWGGIIDELYPDSANGVLVDGNYIYVTGSFVGTTDFSQDEPGEEYTSNGIADIYLCKFDLAGKLLWARTWGGSNWDGGLDIAIDNNGNVYITGGFASSNVDFDPGPGTDIHSSYSMWTNVFLSKFDPNGNFLWARTWGGVGVMKGDCGLGVAVDSYGFVYVTGTFSLTVDFDPGPGTDYRSTSGMYDPDIFLSKFGSDGIYQWALTWGGIGDAYWECGKDLVIDNQGFIYITGCYSSITDFVTL